MWISKDEYNRLTQNSELGVKVGMKLAEVLATLNNTQLELLQTKQELNDAKDYANHLKASRDEVIEEYNAKIKSLIAARDEFERRYIGAQAAYESEHAEANEWFFQYTISEENRKRAKEKNEELERMREELAKEASELERELAHADVDLVLYKKAFDDIAHAFGDEFRYLLMKEAIAEEQHPVEAHYATWAVSNLWFVVHDIMKNAGWRVGNEQDSKD